NILSIPWTANYDYAASSRGTGISGVTPLDTPFKEPLDYFKQYEIGFSHFSFYEVRSQGAIIYVKNADPGWLEIRRNSIYRELMKLVYLNGGPQEIHLSAKELAAGGETPNGVFING